MHEGQTEEQDEVIYEVCYIGENVGRQARLIPKKKHSIM